MKRIEIPSVGKFFRGAAVSLVLVCHFSNVTLAGTFNYAPPTLGPVAPGISFPVVIEQSSTDTGPLFGAPELITVGLDFDPVEFAANSSGEAADISDGTLSLMIVGNVSLPEVVAIDSIDLFEAGDYSLVGGGTKGTTTSVGALIGCMVTEIDGVAVPGINLSPTTASMTFNLVDNGGIAKPWSMTSSLDIRAQLTAREVPFSVGATKVNVTITNFLLASSEAGAFAAIGKKDIRMNVGNHVGSTVDVGEVADFDGNGMVTAQDLATWTNNMGLTSGANRAQGDADGDGDVDGADMLVWQRQFGSSPVSSTSTVIPEPATSLLLSVAVVGILLRRRVK